MSQYAKRVNKNYNRTTLDTFFELDARGRGL